MSFTLLALGWILFSMLVAFNWNGNVNARIVLGMFGFTSLVCGTVSFLVLLFNKNFWLKQKELEDAINKYRESMLKYDEATIKLREKITGL